MTRKKKAPGPALEEPAWAEVLGALGLRPVRVLEGESISEWSFSAFRREIAEPITVALRTSTWFSGEHEDVAVVVRPAVLSPSARYVAVVAEINPPLFAGARVYSRSLTPFFGATPEMPLDNAQFDAELLIQSFDRPRLDRVLGAKTPNPDSLPQHLLAAAQTGPIILRDGLVEALLSEKTEPDPQRVEERLQTAVAIAPIVSQRSERLRETPGEAAARGGWEAYASQVPLAFNRRRWRLWGKLQGVDVEATLGGSPPSVFTTFRADFPTPLGCGLYVRRGVREVGGLAGLLRRKDGLEAIVVIDARDEGRKKTLFSNPLIRERVAKEAREANLFITDSGVRVTKPGFASPADIAVRLESLASIVHAFCPPRAAGPFR